MLDQQTADAISAGIGTAGQFVAPINPVIPLVLGVVQAAIKAEPKVESTLRALFTKPSLTPQDFDDAIAHIQATDYEKLVPNTDLPRQPAPAPDLEPPRAAG